MPIEPEYLPEIMGKMTGPEFFCIITEKSILGANRETYVNKCSSASKHNR